MQRRLGAVLAGLLVAAPTLGACSVSAGNSDRDTARNAAQRVLSGGLDVDTSQPPSRDDLGMADGQTSTVLQLPGRMPFDAKVRFSDGHELDATGRVLIVTSKQPDGPPTAITVRRDGLTMADLETTLTSAVADLGADRTRADAVLTQSRRATSGSSDVIRSLPTGVAAPDRLEIESVVSAHEGRVSVNYLASWSPR